jgi:ribosomal protein S7
MKENSERVNSNIESLFTPVSTPETLKGLYKAQEKLSKILEKRAAEKKAATIRERIYEDYVSEKGRPLKLYEKHRGLFGNQWVNETISNEGRVLLDTFKGHLCKHGKLTSAESICLTSIQRFIYKLATYKDPQEGLNFASLGTIGTDEENTDAITIAAAVEQRGFVNNYIPDFTSHSYDFDFVLANDGTIKVTNDDGYQEHPSVVKAGVRELDTQSKNKFNSIEELSRSYRSKVQVEPGYTPDHLKKARNYPRTNSLGETVIGKAHEATRIGGRARGAVTRNGLAAGSIVQAYTALRFVVDRCKPAVESVSVRKGARTRSRPVGRTPVRQDAVALRTLIKNALKRKTGSLPRKLSQERFEIAQGLPSNPTLRAKVTAHRLAAANRGQLS